MIFVTLVATSVLVVTTGKRKKKKHREDRTNTYLHSLVIFFPSNVICYVDYINLQSSNHKFIYILYVLG